MTSRIVPLALLGGCLALTGCATTSDLESLRADLKDVRGVAEKTASDAAAAKAEAESAAATANAAKQQSDETAAKIDRMFKKAMYK